MASEPLPSPLSRPFRVIAFDWDGTAVMGRREDAREVRGRIERLLEVGVVVFVVTGTSFANLEPQLSTPIRGPYKSNLFVSTNRGSEIWGFDAESRPVPISTRRAKPEEEVRLTRVAERVRERLVRRTGLDVRIVYDRVNRRKVDLIPLPEWADPPKSAMPELGAAVDERLRSAGLDGGLEEAIRLALEVVRESGAPLRVTSDRKHIEIGLTDKSDAAAWLAREVVRRRGIANEDVLLVGDEFGPVGGLPGSDALMMLPELRGAVVVSVGPEPTGVPEGVIHLGGGPARFCELLSAQAAMHPLTLPAQRTPDEDWLLIEQGRDIAREREIESIFAVGNGYVGCRASLMEGGDASSPATFLAGVFESRAGAQPELAPVWAWSNLRVSLDGAPLTLQEGRFILHRRMLDMRKGIVWREWHHLDASGRATELESMLLASRAAPHLLVHSVAVTAPNYSGSMQLETALPGMPVHVEGWGTQRLLAFELPVEGSRVRIAIGTLTRVVAQSGAPVEPELVVEESGAFERCHLQLTPGARYRFDRVAAVSTSRDAADPVLAVQRAIERVVLSGVQGVVDRHVRAWDDRWRTTDVRVDRDPAAQRALRFAVYHLVSAANAADERVSIGARALTGPIYAGHVFWDTEIYMLPFYDLTAPESARALLMYRFHTLPAARARARSRGYRGALYAWESADTGEDVTPPCIVAPTGEVLPVATAESEHHISADVAYGVWRHYWTTLDHSFLLTAGAEILFETARFWASRVTPGDDGLFHIRNVMGPDEYHAGVVDNAYTNAMAQWNLERAVEVAGMLRERWPARAHELAAKIALDDAEIDAWRTVAARMYVGVDPKTGVIEQFRGYFALEDVSLAGFEPRTAPVDLILGRERTQRSKIVKQADVVLLLYLLWDRFAPEVRDASFRYYEPRCAHGSSLSPCIHALVAARLDHVDLAVRYFRQSAEIDLADNMGNAAGGVHAAALGGLWQAAVFGFAGVDLRADGPVATPHLPPFWRSLLFDLEWRGRWVAVDARHEGTAVRPLLPLGAAS